MGVLVVAEIAVVGVGMGVEMDHADRPLLGDGAEDRQRDQVVAAGRQRQAPAAWTLAKKRSMRPSAVHQVDRIDRRVAEIGDARQLVGRDAADMMHLAHEARHVADLARPVARAGAVGGAAVPRHADQRDVEARRIGHVRQAHEGRDVAEARHDGAVNRLGEGLGNVVHDIGTRRMEGRPLRHPGRSEGFEPNDQRVGAGVRSFAALRTTGGSRSLHQS